MTIERPMLPPRRENPFRLVGGSEATPLSAKPEQDEAPADFRSRDLVDHDIRAHTAARLAYTQAVAWEAAAEDSNLPQSQIEDARKAVVEAFEEMNWRARCLVVSMPTDLRGLVDLMMYLEKHFSILPPEVDGKSLALELLKTTRLSLRKVVGYGKVR